MPTLQSVYSRGNARRELPTPIVAGTPIEVTFQHVFTTSMTTADTLELMPLPPLARITAFEYQLVGVAAGNVTFGYMSGRFGSDDPARTVGTELVNASASTTGSLTLAQINALARNGDSLRSIGMRHSVATTAGAGVQVHIRLRYTLDA